MNADDRIIDECEEFEEEVAMDATFAFPEALTEHVILGKHLIIAPEYANWLVLDNDEYEAFGLFRAGKDIQETGRLLAQKLHMDADQAMEVVSRLLAQVLGKKFDRGAEVVEKESFKAISIHLTAGCNLRCTTCLAKATVADSNECSFDEWQKFLKAYAHFGGEFVTMTGGEPMTNPDCPKIIACAKKLGLQVAMLTNGTLINENNAQFFSHHCEEIQISIDGPDARTHESVRGRGTFGKAVAALKALNACLGCHLSIAMTPTPETLPAFRIGLRQFAEWVWSDISPDISLRVTQRLLEGRDIPCMSKQDTCQFRQDVCALCADQLEPDFIYKLDAASMVPNRRMFGCGLAESFSVMPNGDVKVCSYSSTPFGNIKEMGEDGTFIPRIVESLRALAKSTRVEQLPVCCRCDIRYICGGKCRRDNNVEYGDPTICECGDEEKNTWYERLIRVSPYLVQPITDLEGG